MWHVILCPTSWVNVLLFLSMSPSIGLVAQNVVGDMGRTSPGMNQNGVTDERGTQSGITICAAGVMIDVAIVLKNAGGQETVQR